MAKYRLPNINKVFLVGNATADTNLMYTSKGNPFCMFTLAVNRNYRDRNTGNWEKSTEFISVQLRGKVAERLCERIKKGTPVFVEGRLHTYKREIEGKNITHTIVSAFSAQILHSFAEGEEGIIPPEVEAQPDVETTGLDEGPVEGELPPIETGDEDLPF